MNEIGKHSGNYITRNKKNNMLYITWTVAWVGSMILVDKAVKYGWYSSDLISILAIVVNTALGLGVMVAFMRMLKGMDDLQRNIQLNALALAVGAGFVGGFCYLLLATSNLISEAEISDILLLMAIAYMASVIYGQVKYR